jgi:hypothetical protein
MDALHLLRHRCARPVLGTFSKGADGSYSLNFGTSGGKYCDRSCKHHPQSTARGATRSCYAVAVERRPDRAGLLTKLRRHERTNPTVLVRQALLEIQRLVNHNRPPCWLRISTGGSVPGPLEATPSFVHGLRVMVAYCNEHDVPVHFPVETTGKAEFYRLALDRHIVVRESVTDDATFLVASGPIAYTAGRPDQTRRLRVEACRQLAKARKIMTGRPSLLCPAITSRFLSTDNKPDPRFKCGKCRACVCPGLDVLYPLH